MMKALIQIRWQSTNSLGVNCYGVATSLTISLSNGCRNRLHRLRCMIGDSLSKMVETFRIRVRQ